MGDAFPSSFRRRRSPRRFAPRLHYLTFLSFSCSRLVAFLLDFQYLAFRFPYRRRRTPRRFASRLSYLIHFFLTVFVSSFLFSTSELSLSFLSVRLRLVAPLLGLSDLTSFPLPSSLPRRYAPRRFRLNPVSFPYDVRLTVSFRTRSSSFPLRFRFFHGNSVPLPDKDSFRQGFTSVRPNESVSVSSNGNSTDGVSSSRPFPFLSDDPRLVCGRRRSKPIERSSYGNILRMTF